MDAARWQHIQDLFGTAATLPSAERASWLQRNCGHDPTLQAEVESLLLTDFDRAQQIYATIDAVAVVVLEAALSDKHSNSATFPAKTASKPSEGLG